MIEILGIMLANALLILGIHLATWHGNILGFIRPEDEIEDTDRAGLGFSSNGNGHKDKREHWNKLPDWITKPLYDCPTCMASLHSTYFYWYFMPHTWDSLLWYPFYIVALSGLSTFIYRQIE